MGRKHFRERDILWPQQVVDTQSDACRYRKESFLIYECTCPTNLPLQIRPTHKHRPLLYSFLQSTVCSISHRTIFQLCAKSRGPTRRRRPPIGRPTAIARHPARQANLSHLLLPRPPIEASPLSERLPVLMQRQFNRRPSLQNGSMTIWAPQRGLQLCSVAQSHCEPSMQVATLRALKALSYRSLQDTAPPLSFGLSCDKSILQQQLARSRVIS